MRRVREHAHLIRHRTALANAPIPNSDTNPGFNSPSIALVGRVTQGDSDASARRSFIGDCDQFGYLPLDNSPRHDALSGRAPVS